MTTFAAPAKPAVFLNKVLPSDVSKMFGTHQKHLRFEDRVYAKRIMSDLRAKYGDVEFVTTIPVNPQ